MGRVRITEYFGGITMFHPKKLPQQRLAQDSIHSLIMNDDTIKRMQHQRDEDKKISADKEQDEFFEDDGEDEPLDESETDEDADEGIGDGKIGRRFNDPLEK